MSRMFCRAGEETCGAMVPARAVTARDVIRCAVMASELYLMRLARGGQCVTEEYFGAGIDLV